MQSIERKTVVFSLIILVVAGTGLFVIGLAGTLAPTGALAGAVATSTDIQKGLRLTLAGEGLKIALK